MVNSLYCKLFIDSDKSVEELENIICLILGGKIHPIRTIEIKEAAFDLRINKEFDLKKGKNKDDGFLYWKYFLDIEPIKTSKIDYINIVRDLMNQLKKQSIDSIAACDFEDRLSINE